MKKHLVFIWAFCALNARCQHMLPIIQDSTWNKKASISFTTNGDYASNAIGKNIAQAFFYGGFISQDMKNQSIERLQNINQFGLDINAELLFHSQRNLSSNVKNPFCQYGFQLQAGVHSFSSMVFSRDAFRYAFEGNSLFIGDTANFSGTRFQSMTYSKVGFGIVDRKSNNSISLNVLSLNQFASGKVEKGNVFQNQSNDSMQLVYNGAFCYSNQTSFLKGLGLSLDFDYRFKTMENNRIMTFQLLAKNLGFILPMPSLTKYEADSSFQYTGFNLDQLIQQNIVHTGVIMDTLGVHQSIQKTALLVPGFIQFSKLVDLQSAQRIQSFYGARMFLSKNYIPYFFVGAHGRLTKWWSIGMSASYGGFSHLKWGTYSAIQFSRWNIGIASENLLSKTGESFIIQVKCAF